MMINIDSFMDDIYTPLIQYTDAPQILKANQKIPDDMLEDNRIIYNVIVFANTDSRQTIIREMDTVDSDSEDFDYDIKADNITFPEGTLSITGFGNEILTPLNKAREWFYTVGLGDMWLRDSQYNAVIREVMEIDDRTVYLESDYEKRYGFDVIIEFKDVVKVRHDTIERVEFTNKTTNQTKEIDL